MSELIYGRHAVLEALRAARRRIYRLWLEGVNGSQDGGIVAEILERAEAAKIPTRSIKGGLFDKLAQQRVNAQGVALEVDGYPYVELEDILAQDHGEPPLLLILDHIQDPQNLGALFRTAEAMAVHGVIIPERRAAGITPAVSNASAGAVEQLRVAQVTNLNRTIDTLKAQNIWVTGLDSGPDAPLLEESALTGAVAVVVGGEAEGISRLTREKCDFLVRLPMYGRVESLNAAVAGSIVLYLARQTRA